MKRAVAVVACALVLLPAEAAAQRVRRRFDPEDLKLEEPGVLHADMAFGAVRGEAAGRWLLPDFDVDFGIGGRIELGVDGAWAIEGTDQRAFAWDHAAPDNLWLSSKVGLWDDGDARAGWAFGVQLGPRVAVAPDAHGAGAQGLFLLGRRVGGTQLVLNGGGLLEPGGAVGHDRPEAILTGVDASIDVDGNGPWSISADLSGVFFTSGQAHQVTSTIGPTCSVTPWLDLTASALVGFLAGGDRWGAFVNVAPKIPFLSRP